VLWVLMGVMPKPSAPAQPEGSPLKRIPVIGTAQEPIAKMRRVHAATMIRTGSNEAVCARIAITTTITTAITGEEQR
jgi:hypothetical protein